MAIPKENGYVMSHNLKGSVNMAIGTSGRLVIEVDPDFKKNFYNVLEADGLTLKEWFLQAAREHISRQGDHNVRHDDIEHLGKQKK